MSEAVTLNDLGTTDMLVRTSRPSMVTAVEVEAPEVVTELQLRMTTRTVHLAVTGGPPGGQGERGADGVIVVVTEPAETYDPGDFTLIFENKLI